MPDKKTIEKAEQDKREGKSASTQAGEFVHAEIDKIRKGKHGARSAKQAIAIGLSEARRAGVKVKSPGKGSSAKTKASAKSASKNAGKPVSKKRSAAVTKALKRESTSTVSPRALSKQAKAAAKKRSAANRSSAAKKASRTKGAEGRSAAAKKAARTRAKR